MIDPEVKEVLLKSLYPEKVDSPQVAIDLLSTAYLEDVISRVFELPDNPSHELDLARLSLASSLLDRVEKNSFLVGESQNIIGMINPLAPPNSLKDIANLTDIAVKYHISNYDANAAIVAKKVLELLSKDDVRISYVQRNYFFYFSKFLNNNLQSFRSVSTVSVYSSPEEQKLFSFLSQVMIALISYYDDGQPIDNGLSKTLSRLNTISKEREFPWIWAQEINHVFNFLKFAEKKALIPRLLNINNLSRSYIKSIKNRFIWPSTEEFLEKYFYQKNHNAVINTPTGSGKTFLSELATASALTEGWVLYLAPTNALCNQVSTVYKRNLSPIIKGNISVTFGYEEYSRLKFNKNKIFVTTPEKALIFLKLDPTAFQSCSLVILDECHILDDRNRGATAEIVLSLLLKVSSNLRVILMSALLENNTELASWLTTVTNKKTALISSKWKPTRIARFIVSLDESTKQPYKNNGNYSENLAIHADSESPWNSESDFLLEWTLPIQLHSKRRGTEFPFVNDAARVLSEELVLKGKRTMLFVIRNRHHVFSIGDKWEKESSKPFNLNSYEKALIYIAEFELGISSHVAKLLTEKCIAVHSSSMLESEKLLTLSAFGRRESNVRTFIATGTLSQGMNLNFDAVVIAGTDRFQRSTNQRVEHEILNAMGRAARANYAIYGISFIVPTQKISKNFSKAQLINNSTCIDKIDASTKIESDFRRIIEESIETIEINSCEKKLLALLPANPEKMSSVLINSWAMTYSPPIDHRFLLTKLHQIQQDLVDDQNLPSWLLESASVASFFPWDAVKLYNAIISSNLEPKIDTYSSFAVYLIDLLNFDSFELFEKLIDDHINIFMGKEYANNEKREQVIISLKNTVRLWLNGGDYLQISTENDRYKKNTITEKWKRSSAHANIPNVFKWIKEVAGRLSRYGGLLYAIKEKWITNQPASIPSWLENSRSIGTLSLGIKNGVNSPEALACYESILHERIIAKILSESSTHQLINCDEIDYRHLFANKVLTEFLTEAHNGVFSDPILKNLEQVVKQHAQND